MITDHGRRPNGHFALQREGKTESQKEVMENRRIMAQYYRARESAFNAAARCAKDNTRYEIITVIKDNDTNSLAFIGTEQFMHNFKHNRPIIDSSKACPTTIQEQLAYIQKQKENKEKQRKKQKENETSSKLDQ